ncbi:MAG TPA: hypothetical protein VFV38_52045 [Ktedonobacteraceae bacterium]|nr:hypothetical protein [Ktedonobacteraceae bacterium]
MRARINTSARSPTRTVVAPTRLRAVAEEIAKEEPQAPQKRAWGSSARQHTADHSPSLLGRRSQTTQDQNLDLAQIAAVLTHRAIPATFLVGGSGE